jgi:hypothetical protein
LSHPAGGGDAGATTCIYDGEGLFEVRAIKTVNLKSDMPQVREALQRLDRELDQARRDKAKCLKLIHGYGSSGTGGEIRIAIQKRLIELQTNGEIRACIFGENWSKSDQIGRSHMEAAAGPFRAEERFRPRRPQSRYYSCRAITERLAGFLEWATLTLSFRAPFFWCESLP